MTRFVAVTGIADERVTDVASVHADLMGAAGLYRDVDERGVGEAATHREAAGRRLPGGIDDDATLAGVLDVPRERGVDAADLARPVTGDQRDVALVDGALAEQRLQGPAATGIAGDQQAAAGASVEAVDELQRRRRESLAQRVDGTEGEPAAAVHGDAGRLGDEEEILVLAHDRVRQRVRQRVGHARLAARGHAQRRDAHLLALDQATRLPDAAPVDAYLALTDQTVDMALGHARRAADQEVVDPLAGLAGTDALVTAS